MSFLNNISIKRKIFGGFGVVLILLVTVGATAYFGLTRSERDFKDYRALAIETNQAGRVQANLLTTRMLAKDFIINPRSETIEAVNERAEAGIQMAEELITISTTQHYRDLSTQIKDQLRVYRETFVKASEFQGQRDAQVLGVMNKVGPEMRKKLSEIMETAAQDNDTEAAYLAGVSMQHLLLARLYAFRYLDNNDDVYYERVVNEFISFRQAGETMLESLQNPQRRQLTLEIKNLASQYLEGFQAAHTAISSRNELIRGTLDVIGPVIAREIEDMKLEIKAEQDEMGPIAVADMAQAVQTGTTVTILALVVGLISAFLLGNGISRPIKLMTAAMTSLSEGNKTVTIPAQGQKDEVGLMAKAVQVFKENMIKSDELTKAQEEEQRQRLLRSEKIEELLKDFEANATSLTKDVIEATNSIQEASVNAGARQNESGSRSMEVAEAAGRTSNSIRSTASAADKLSGSIEEISARITEAANRATDTVQETEEANLRIEGLSSSSEKIGEIVSIISDIANQTNLLALNATIEAARAGETGKGFAVVAAEVKNLANQTARATNEIEIQINGIQSQVVDAVNGVSKVNGSVGSINELATSVATAVDEQATATQGIANNTEMVKTDADAVSSNVTQLVQASAQAAAQSIKTMWAAETLNQSVNSFDHQLSEFLCEVRSI